jgi:hypothetical protein
MKKFVAVLIVLWVLSFNASAGTHSGIWWNASESGWGINFVQHGDTLFSTMYVYNPSGQPTWYTAVLKPVDTAVNNYSGELFTAAGPYFGGFFNPAAVNARRVGTMSFNAPSFVNATLSYSVDGVSVTKAIVPFNVAVVPATGTYAITFLRDAANNCNIPIFNTSLPTQLVVTTNSVQLLNAAGASICTGNGNVTQAGAMYAFVGNAPSCFPSGRMIGVDLRFEGIASVSNANVFATGTILFQDASNCISSFYLAGVRTR